MLGKAAFWSQQLTRTLMMDAMRCSKLLQENARNSECSTGCPCEGGYKCKENIMAMCQMPGSSANVNFTYVISADGLYQETLSLFLRTFIPK